MVSDEEGGPAVKPAAARNVAIVLLAGGLLIGLGACNSGTANRPAGAVASTSGAAPGTAHRGIPKSAFAELESFTGPAVAEYGRTNVQAAYEEMVNYVFETAWNPSMIRKNSALLTGADFANARSYMTSKFRTAFDATFAKVMQADKAAIKKLEHAMFFGVSGPNGARPVTTGNVVTGRKFSRASLDVDRSQGYHRLSMTFSAKADIQLQDAPGKRYTLPASRIVRYWLVRNTGSDAYVRPFLIDSWAIRLTTSQPLASK